MTKTKTKTKTGKISYMPPPLGPDLIFDPIGLTLQLQTLFACSSIEIDTYNIEVDICWK